MTALVEAARFDSGIDAQVAWSALSAAGVHAVLFDAGMSGAALGGAIPIRLMVLDKDLADARAVLAG